MIPEPSPPPTSSRRGLGKAILLLFGVFLLGNLTGIGGSIVVILKRFQENVRHPELITGPTSRFLHRTESQLTQELHLTPAEQLQVRAELQKTRDQIIDIRLRRSEEMRQLTRETIDRIAANLPPEKQAGLRKHAQKQFAPWGLLEKNSD
jgi:hypothetical protein